MADESQAAPHKLGCTPHTLRAPHGSRPRIPIPDHHPLGKIRSIPETLDHFFILNRVFYHYYTTTLLIILITTLQIRIIRVQVIINGLLLGSWLLLLTHPTGTRVEINLDAVLSCNLAKELLNLE